MTEQNPLFLSQPIPTSPALLNAKYIRKVLSFLFVWVQNAFKYLSLLIMCCKYTGPFTLQVRLWGSYHHSPDTLARRLHTDPGASNLSKVVAEPVMPKVARPSDLFWEVDLDFHVKSHNVEYCSPKKHQGGKETILGQEKCSHSWPLDTVWGTPWGMELQKQSFLRKVREKTPIPRKMTVNLRVGPR